MIVKAFSFVKIDSVSWQLRNQWFASNKYILDINLIISHIYREGNRRVDFFANLDCTSNVFTLFYSLSIEIRSDYIKIRLGLPLFKFRYF